MRLRKHPEDQLGCLNALHILEHCFYSLHLFYYGILFFPTLLLIIFVFILLSLTHFSLTWFLFVFIYFLAFFDSLYLHSFMLVCLSHCILSYLRVGINKV